MPIQVELTDKPSGPGRPLSEKFEAFADLEPRPEGYTNTELADAAGMAKRSLQASLDPLVTPLRNERRDGYYQNVYESLEVIKLGNDIREGKKWRRHDKEPVTLDRYIWFSGEQRSYCKIQYRWFNGKLYIAASELPDNPGPSIALAHESLLEALKTTVSDMKEGTTVFLNVFADPEDYVEKLVQEVFKNHYERFEWRDFDSEQYYEIFPDSTRKQKAKTSKGSKKQ